MSATKITKSTTVELTEERIIFDNIIAKGLITQYAQSGKYMDWMRIGWAIKNVFDDKTLWHQFSRLGCSVYDEDECDDVWDRMQKTNDIGFGTIIRYAKQTDESAVKQIYTERKEQNIYEKSPLKEGSDDVKLAMFFHLVFPNKIITVREQTYYFNGIHWVKTDKKYGHVQRLVSFEFVDEINAFYNYSTKKYTNAMSKETDEERRKILQDRIKHFDKTKSEIVTRLLSQSNLS